MHLFMLLFSLWRIPLKHQQKFLIKESAPKRQIPTWKALLSWTSGENSCPSSQLSPKAFRSVAQTRFPHLCPMFLCWQDFYNGFPGYIPWVQTSVNLTCRSKLFSRWHIQCISFNILSLEAFPMIKLFQIPTIRHFSIVIPVSWSDLP